MQTYKAVGPTELFSGKLKLTVEQSLARVIARKLAPTSTPNVFEIIAPVQFKAGEVIGFDGAPPDSLYGMDEEITKTETGENDVLPKRVRRR